MIDLNKYSNECYDIVTDKGWNKTFPWLAWKLQCETTEFLLTIEDNKPTPERLEEYSDIQFVLGTLASINFQNHDLNKACISIQQLNKIRLKKTWDPEHGIVKK